MLPGENPVRGIMRIATVLLLGTALISVSASASRAQTTSTPAVQKAVFALEEEWTRALVKVDTVTFKRLTAPGFVYTEDNAVMNQRELLHAIVTGDKVDWAGNEGMKLYHYGDVAVVTGVLITRGRTKAGTFTNRYRFTDTWYYSKGQWRAIAAQDYLIPKR